MYSTHPSVRTPGTKALSGVVVVLSFTGRDSWRSVTRPVPHKIFLSFLFVLTVIKKNCLWVTVFYPVLQAKKKKIVYGCLFFYSLIQSKKKFCLWVSFFIRSFSQRKHTHTHTHSIRRSKGSDGMLMMI